MLHIFCNTLVKHRSHFYTAILRLGRDAATGKHLITSNAPQVLKFTNSALVNPTEPVLKKLTSYHTGASQTAELRCKLLEVMPHLAQLAVSEMERLQAAKRESRQRNNKEGKGIKEPKVEKERSIKWKILSEAIVDKAKVRGTFDSIVRETSGLHTCHVKEHA